MSFASIAVRDVSFSFGPKLVLTGVSFTLGPATRMGVVGPNGTGKSTLLRLLSAELTPDSGSITATPPDASLGYLPQESAARDGETVDAYVRRRTGVAGAEADLESSALGLAGGSSAAADRYDLALRRFEQSGAADFDVRLPLVLASVGLPADVASAPMGRLSGGQRARASLASILLSRFDLLMLDEPTNDLDFAGLALLERFVTESNVGMLIVSHDREFLERTTNATLELDPHSYTATEYNGGWLAYQQERTTAQALASERHSHYESTRADLLERARRQRSWSDKGVTQRNKNPKDNDKFQRNFFNDKTEKQAGKARQTEKALERLEVVEKPFEGWELHMELPSAQRSGDIVVRLDEAVVERGDFRLGPVDLEITAAERVAVVGLNGAGKSTLVQALLGRLPLIKGAQRIGPSVVIGELDQVREVFSSDTPLIAAFERESQLLRQEVRSLLAKFGLTAEHVERAGKSLSPGERTRAMLALLMARETNLLVLDEPTNHLDIEAIEQLEQALESYDGTILLITHDRRLLETMRVTRTLTIEAGAVTSG